MIRRSFVLSAAAMTLALAGCKGSSSTSTPTPTPSPTPSPSASPVTYAAFPLTSNTEFGTIDSFMTYTGDLAVGPVTLGVAGTEAGSTRFRLAALADPTAASNATGGTPYVIRDNLEEGRFGAGTEQVVQPATTVPEFIFQNTTVLKNTVSTTVLSSRAELLNNTVATKITTDPVLGALKEVSYAGWIRDDSATGDHRVTYGVFGYPTVTSDFPTTGTATYSAKIAGRAVGVTGGTGSIVKLGGTVTVTINFGTGAVTYTANVTQIVGGVESAYATYTGSGAVPSGTAQFSGSFGASSPIPGTFTGTLFGAAGAELGISFAGAGTTTGGVDTRIAGVIVGKKN